MSIWKTKFFQNWQKKQSISDKMLLEAIDEIQRGLIDADLGGGLIKKRVSRQGGGKRSGYRTLLATNKKNRWFFVYGFAKNDKENISDKEVIELKELSAYLLNLSDSQINDAENKNIINKVKDQ